MAAYLLDTDTCVSIMRGPSEKLARRMCEIPLEEQAISVVTLAELLYGVRVSGGRPKQNRAALEAFAKYVSTLDWTAGAAEHYAEIRSHLRKRGQVIGANDLMIAAHARDIGAVLVTNNEREFRRVPSLMIENWMS
ncbi:MAG TPA: type II toxin-antitoxin system VapC family toxin [Casimicrobiaceae bacterium]